MRPAPRRIRPRDKRETQMSANQEKAMQIGHALQDAGLNGYDIEIMYQNGRCVLQGVVGTPQQRAGAAQIANSVPGVQSVANQLRLQGQAGPSAGSELAQLHDGRLPDSGSAGGSPAPVTNGGPGPIGPPGMPQVPGSDQPMPGGMPPMGAPIPATGPGPQSSGPAYDNPNLPQYGWPSYAQYPNYAASDLSQPIQRQCVALHRTVLSLSAGASELAESDPRMVGRPLGPQF